jgi:hypothetical protein
MSRDFDVPCFGRPGHSSFGGGKMDAGRSCNGTGRLACENFKRRESGIKDKNTKVGLKKNFDFFALTAKFQAKSLPSQRTNLVKSMSAPVAPATSAVRIVN